MKIRAPIWQKLEYVLPAIAVIVIIAVMLVSSYDHSGVSAAGIHGLTGTGRSSDFVTTSSFPTITNLSQMGTPTFTKYRSPNNSPTCSGNHIELTSCIAYSSAERIRGGDATMAHVNAVANIPMSINMKQSWILKCKVRVPSFNRAKSGAAVAILLEDGIHSPVGFIAGGENVTGNNSRAFCWGTVSDYSGTVIHRIFSLHNYPNNSMSRANDFGVDKDMVLQYNSSDGSMTCTYGTYSAAVPSSSSPFRTSQGTAKIKLFGYHRYNNDTARGTNNKGYVNFQSFQYTNYDREITSTEIQDSAGRKITGPVGSGHTISVKHNLKGVKDNKFFNANRQASDNID